MFFLGGLDVDPKKVPSKKNATQKEEEDHHHHHGTKPGSIEGGRLRRVLEQSGNHGFVSAGRVERDGEENRRRVVRRDGVRDRAARRDGDVRFSCRRRRRRLFLCGRGRSRVASSRCLFCLSLLSFRATSIGATGSGKVRQSPRARSHLCRSHRGSNRKSLTVNISLSFFLSNRYAANYKEQEKLDHRF